MTALHRACKQTNHWAVISLLEGRSSNSRAEILVHEDETGRKPLHYAAREGRIELIRLILDSFPLDTTTLVQFEDDRGQTPLHVAAQYGKINAIKPLVTKHPHRRDCLAMRDSSSLTARELAIKSGMKKTAALLAAEEIPFLNEIMSWCFAP
ncbi:hypothetical protein ACLMJK_008729 [Lecanora helva]